MRRRDFVKVLSTGVVGGHALACAPVAAPASAPVAGPAPRTGIDPGSYDESWWNRRPLRLVQTNLREIDARMDLDAYVRWMVDHSVNLVLLNVGGIVANYPTRLEYHYRNPFMQGDLVGDLTSRLHAEGIRVMGRFDFSKINEELAALRPDWLYVSEKGENVNYNGQVHTCPSRGYQQEYSFRILEEAITSYPLDAVFFNMVGYQTTDYSGNYYGDCHCEDCLRLFGEGSTTTRREVANDLFTRMHRYIRELNPEIVISTYTTVGVDMVSTESSSSLSLAHEWNYSATDNVKRTFDSYNDLVPMNLVIGFQAIGYRLNATSPGIARVWQTQNMLHGGSLYYVFIGPAHEYPDRAFVPTLKDLYAFHATNAALFTNLQSAARVALVRGPTEEYRGLIKLLAEAHVPYDILDPEVIGSSRMPRPLESYDTAILGDLRNMSDELASRFDRYVQEGGKLLATGFTSVRTSGAGGRGGEAGSGRGGQEGADPLAGPDARILLQCLGVAPAYEFSPREQSTYLQISEADRGVLGRQELSDFDLMMLYSDYMRVRPRSGARGLLNIIPSTMFGPPEKAYFLEEEVTDYPGVVVNSHGSGRSVFVPWGIGAQYYAKGHHIHRAFFNALLRNVLRAERLVETDAPGTVEISHLVNRNGAFEWVGMINHASQLGPTLSDPLPVYDTTLRLRPSQPVREVFLQRSGAAVDFREVEGGWLEVKVPVLRDFEMVVCTY
ncbi:MAG TPA: alpha-amylase family protein [Longimicrobiaceae bacterium]